MARSLWCGRPFPVLGAANNRRRRQECLPRLTVCAASDHPPALGGGPLLTAGPTPAAAS